MEEGVSSDTNDTEYWKKIDGFKNYSVSNLGRVRNDKRKTFKTLQLDDAGYYTISLWKNNERKDFRVNRLVGLAFIPNPDNLPEVHHINPYNKKNNRVSNLKWVTSLENGQSKNKTVNIGCVSSYVTKGIKYSKAKITIYGKQYTFDDKNEDKCQDWLNRRRFEIVNDLEVTELNIKTRKKGTGNIRLTNNGKSKLEIVINKVRTCKTFDTYAEAEAYIEILKSK